MDWEIFLLIWPWGQVKLLQVFFSSRRIILAGSHSEPLFAASTISPLTNVLNYLKQWKLNYVQWWDWFHLVRSLLPPPHVTEQDVQAPHGPTSQLTGWEKIEGDCYIQKRGSYCFEKFSMTWICCFTETSMKTCLLPCIVIWVGLQFAIIEIAPTRRSKQSNTNIKTNTCYLLLWFE